MTTEPSTPELTAEVDDLRARLAEAEDALRAIRNGELDAVVVTGERGERRVYTLSGADRMYRLLINTMSEGALTLSADRVILYCNARLAQMLGRSLDQVLGTDLRDYLPPADQQALDAVLAQVHTAPIRLEINLKASEGRLVPVYLSASRLPADEAELVFCLVLTDLTEQKSHEQIVAATQRIRKLNRIYAMLSNVNQAIVRIRDSQALFEEVCRIAVEDGGLRMAWIGLVDPAGRRVLPTAHAGVTDGYLEMLNIVLGDDARGHGPTGSAVRSGKHEICRDIENDPCMMPWREEALRNGYRSSAAFPLKASGGEVRGTFNLYAVEIGCFDDDEIRLLDELATDIGFAMEFAEHEVERKLAEAALKAAEERYRDLFSRANEGLLLMTMDGQVAEINAAFAKMHGYTTAELEAKNIKDLDVLKEKTLEERADIVQRIQAGEVVRFEVEHHHKAGHTFPLAVTTTLITLAGQVFILASHQDITARKQAEERVQEQLGELQRWQDVMLGREDRVHELKREVNELCRHAGEAARYPSQEGGAADAAFGEPKP